MVEGDKEAASRQQAGSTHGPISDGVTGSEGGGGRLINVGVGIFAIDLRCVCCRE